MWEMDRFREMFSLPESIRATLWAEGDNSQMQTETAQASYLDAALASAARQTKEEANTMTWISSARTRGELWERWESTNVWERGLKMRRGRRKTQALEEEKDKTRRGRDGNEVWGLWLEPFYTCLHLIPWRLHCHFTHIKLCLTFLFLT